MAPGRQGWSGSAVAEAQQRGAGGALKLPAARWRMMLETVVTDPSAVGARRAKAAVVLSRQPQGMATDQEELRAVALVRVATCARAARARRVARRTVTA